MMGKTAGEKAVASSSTLRGTKSTKDAKKLKALHPKSRKAKKFVQHILKEEKAGQHFFDRNLKLNTAAQKLIWFRDELKDLESCTTAQFHTIIDRYLHRFDEELEQIEIENTLIKTRKGRKHAAREDAIRMTLEKDLRDYQFGGIELPDILDKRNFERFKDWDGNTNELPAFKLVAYTQKSVSQL